ncbi:hypothetical protein ACFQ60_04095 [Streptomyces zhihengii]
MTVPSAVMGTAIAVGKIINTHAQTAASPCIASSTHESARRPCAPPEGAVRRTRAVTRALATPPKQRRPGPAPRTSPRMEKYSSRE